MRRLITKIKNIIKIANLLSVDDSGNLRIGNAQFLGKEQTVNIFSPYGLIHNPPISSLGVLFQVQSHENNIMSIWDDPKNRTLKNLSSCEVAVSNYNTGDYVYFKTGNVIEIVGVTINANATTTNITSDVNITGDMVITGNLNVTGTITAPTIQANTSLMVQGEEMHNHGHPQGMDSAGNIQQNTGGPV